MSNYALNFNENEPSSIYLNNAMTGRDLSSGWFGLGALYDTPTIHYLELDTFSVSSPSSLYASPIEYFQIDNDHHVVDQILKDIYVSNVIGNDTLPIIFLTRRAIARLCHRFIALRDERH